MLVLVCDDCVQSRASAKSGSLSPNTRRDTEVDALPGSDKMRERNPTPADVSITKGSSVTDGEAAEVACVQRAGVRRVFDELVCSSCQGRSRG